MVKLSRALSGLLVVAGLAACKDPLTVENWNNPDRLRVFARPSDTEALIKGTYKTIFNGTFGSDGIAPSARTMSWENASNLNNWGMGPRSAIPRAPIDNNRGNAYLTENQTDFNAISRGLRAAGDGIYMMETLTLGSAGLNARARAFGWFSLATAMGYLSLDYDSSTIVDPHEDIGVVPDLSGYVELNQAALRAFDSAEAWTKAARDAADGGFPGTNQLFDNSWISGNTFTANQFIALIHTFRAYFRANVARTPADRDAVVWDSVIIDASTGIQSDFQVRTGATVGWTSNGNQWYLYQQWHQLNQMIGGMADSSCVDANLLQVVCGTAGAVRQYDNWLAASAANKVQFLIRTPDRRFPAGNDRATQQTNSGTVSDGVMYFRNRSDADPDAAPWASYYDWYRMLAWYRANREGLFPTFVKAQNDLLLAEAYIRKGQLSNAATLIDISRTRNGLPALSGAWVAAATATTPGPGGVSCVPHVPVGPSYTTTACGNIMEMMKWEYRMETTYVSYVSQWYSGRGWGDLPQGTAIHWPVPYQEMDARRRPFYSLAGVGNAGGVVNVGNYGY